MSTPISLQSRTSLLTSQLFTASSANSPAGARLTTIKYGVTRFRITLFCYQANYVKGRPRNGVLRWVRPMELEDLPLSVTARKLGELVQTNAAAEKWEA